jgi:hypothetical protein
MTKSQILDLIHEYQIDLAYAEAEGSPNAIASCIDALERLHAMLSKLS